MAVTTHVRRLPTEEAYKKAADCFVHFLSELPDRPIPIALPGGRTVAGFLKELLNRATHDYVDIRRLRFFPTDEFKPTDERPETNQALLERVFFNEALERGQIDRSQIHTIDLSRGFDAALAAYQSALDRYGGRFEVAFLSGGGGTYPDGTPDPGHCAGIFPGDEHVWNSEDSLVEVFQAPKPPAYRVTVTPWLLGKSVSIVGFLMGPERAPTLEWFEGGDDERCCPLRLLDRAQRCAVLFTDIV